MRKASRNLPGLHLGTAARTSAGRRAPRKWRSDIEALEGRTLLSYTFVYTDANNVSVAESGGSDSFRVIESAGDLEYSEDGGATYSADWGGAGNIVDASAATTVTISLSGDDSTIQLGDAGQGAAASQNLADFVVTAAAGNTNDSTIIDDSSSSDATTYAVDLSSSGTLTATGINYDESGSTAPFAGGISLLASLGDDTFNALSTKTDEALAITPGAGTTNTVNIGSTGGAGSMGDIQGAITIDNSGTSTALNFHDENDTTGQTWTIDNDDTVPSASVSVSGSATTSYDPSGISGLTINAGSGGNSFYVHQTTSYADTTLNTGTGSDFVHVYSAGDFDDDGTPTLTVDGQDGSDSVILGAHGSDVGMQDLYGTINVSNDSGTTALTLDDSQDTIGQTWTIDNDDTVPTGSVTGANVTTNFNTAQLSSLTIDGGSGGNIFNVNQTTSYIDTTLNTGTGDDTVNVYGAGNFGNNGSPTLNINGQDGSDTVVLGANPTAGMQDLNGTIDVSNTLGTTALTLDDSEDPTGQFWNLHNNDGGGDGSGDASVSLSGSATTNYDPAQISSLTIDGGSGGNEFYVHQTTSYVNTTLNTGTGDDTVHVYSAGNFDDDGTPTLDIDGQDGSDTVILGAHGGGVGMQNLYGTINVSNDSDLTDLILDDSQDTSGQTASINNTTGGTGSITGLSPATIGWTDDDIGSMTIDASNAGSNAFSIYGIVSSATTTLDKGTGSDNDVSIYGTNAGSVLNLTGGASDGTDSVYILQSNPATILGAVNIDEAPDSTNLVIDLSNDGLAHDFVLSSDGTTTTLTDLDGNYPTTTFLTATVYSLTIDTDGSEPQELNVDMGEGANPIPTGGTPGLVYNAGGDGSLNIYGALGSGPFTSEVQNAENPADAGYGPAHYGDFDFVDSTGTATSLVYSGLQPTTDSTPATDYTFNDFGYPDQSFTATSSTFTDPTGTYASILFTSDPTPAPTPPSTGNFEATNVANKANITFNAPAPNPTLGQPGNGLTGTVNITTPSTGLSTLTFNTNTGNNNTVDFVATPVATTLNTSTAGDTTNVTGAGVASGTTLTLNAGSGTDVLNYDAGGKYPTVTAITTPAPGFAITYPGGGTVDALGYSSINIFDTANNAVGTPAVTPPVVTAVPISSVAGFQLVNVIAGTFDFPLPASLIPAFPTGTTFSPTSLPASDFTATINWGDGTMALPDLSSGIIVQDASDPSLYYVEGTHTYATAGAYPTSVTVTFTGGTFTGTNGGTTLSVALPSSTSTSPPSTASVATVNDAVLTVTPFPIVGTEGITLAPAATPITIATFTDGSGTHPVADYSVALKFTSSDGVIYPATAFPQSDFTITPDGTSGQYTVSFSDPSFTLPEEGTYQMLVTITSSVGAPVPTGTGSAQVVIADAPLVAAANQPTVIQDSPTIYPLPVFATPLLDNVPVAYFTDENPLPLIGSSSIADFTAQIDWGDGTPDTAGTIVLLPGGAASYEVLGSHTYATNGVANANGHPTIQVFVQDDGGSRLTVTNNNVTVTYNPLSVTGVVNPASVSGLSTGTPNVTNVNQPNFYGTVLASTSTGVVPDAYAQVTVTAMNTATGVSYGIGSVQAGAGGVWSLTSDVALPDGHYTITATAVDQFGINSTVTPGVIDSNLLIDTQGPVVTSMFWNRLNGQIDYTISDPGATPSGVWLNTLLDSSNYLFTKVNASKAYAGKYAVTNVTATAGSTPDSYNVVVTINGGRSIRGGFYLFTIRDSSNGNSSVQDLAENHLDGVFYGSFPSGNGINGSDFVAELSGYHNKIFAPQTLVGTASAANKGVGGVRKGAVHSGDFTPIVRRAGSIAADKKKELIVKRSIKVRTHTKSVGHTNAKAETHDLAIMALVDTTNGKGKK